MHSLNDNIYIPTIKHFLYTPSIFSPPTPHLVFFFQIKSPMTSICQVSVLPYRSPHDSLSVTYLPPTEAQTSSWCHPKLSQGFNKAWCIPACPCPQWDTMSTWHSLDGGRGFYGKPLCEVCSIMLVTQWWFIQNTCFFAGKFEIQDLMVLPVIQPHVQFWSKIRIAPYWPDSLVHFKYFFIILMTLFKVSTDGSDVPLDDHVGLDG